MADRCGREILILRWPKVLPCAAAELFRMRDCSLVPQRRHRIDAGGAAGGEVAGEEGDDNEGERDGDEGEGVVGGDAEED